MSYTLFDSAIGRIGIAWTSLGIARLQLPELNDTKTLKKIASGCLEPQLAEPPQWVERAIKKIQTHLLGKRQDLSAIKLDLGGISPFYLRVYRAALEIFPGTTVTYGDLAQEISCPRGARAVGQALGKNPIALIIPCHRVVAANAIGGGFSAHGGLATKRRLLEIEGA